MSVHIHSKIAHEAAKPSLENIRKAVRFILFSCYEALTAEEILERVQDYMHCPEITINSIAPRITEMLDDSDISNPPRLKVVGFKYHIGHGGRKVKRRTLRPLNESEQYQWQVGKKKEQERLSAPQLSLF